MSDPKILSVYVDSVPDNSPLISNGPGKRSSAGRTHGFHKNGIFKNPATGFYTNRAFMSDDIGSYKRTVQMRAILGVMPDQYMAVEIHEMGNVLANLTGKYYTAYSWVDGSGVRHEFGDPNQPKDRGDGDTGQAFEQCVYMYMRTRIGIAP